MFHRLWVQIGFAACYWSFEPLDSVFENTESIAFTPGSRDEEAIYKNVCGYKRLQKMQLENCRYTYLQGFR